MDNQREHVPYRNSELDYQPVPYSMLAIIDKLVAKAGLQNCRTEKCEHRGTCIGSMLVSMTKTGLTAYGLKTLIAILFSIKKLFSSPSKLL